MFLVDHVVPCDVCALPARTLTGTYRTGTIGDGVCVVLLDLTETDGSKVNISGVIAVQGSVLLFQIASVAGFGPGLALRSDMLIGQ
jgi:hypothetical protein